MKVEWLRRSGGMKRAHAFIDGAAACTWAGVPGSSYIPADLTTDGKPFGEVCDSCQSAVVFTTRGSARVSAQGKLT